MTRRIPENFKRLEGHTIPQATLAKFAGSGGSKVRETKVGHDSEQEIANKLKKSKGFLSTGKITRCEPVEGYPDFVQIDVDNIPTTTIGGEVNAGRLPGGSVELLPNLPDPNDPSKTIEGPILTGIAHLGHEQPAVRNWPPELRERAKPKAIFADGTPVPPNKSIPSEWLAAMAETEARMSAESATEREDSQFAGFMSFSAAFMPTNSESSMAGETLGKPPKDASSVPVKEMAAKKMAAFAAACKKYSEGGKMEDVEKDHPGFSAAFSSMADAPSAVPGSVPPAAPAAPPPSDAGAGAGGMMSDDAMMAACKKFAEDPAATPEQKMMASLYSSMAKRMGAMEAEAEAKKKAEGEVQMAQMSAMVADKVKKIERKVSPHLIDVKIKPEALAILQTKKFSSETDRMKEFEGYFSSYEKLPDDPRLTPTPPAPVVGADGKVSKADAASLPVRDQSGLLAHWSREGGILEADDAFSTQKLRERIVG